MFWRSLLIFFFFFIETVDQIFNLEKTRREKCGEEISCVHEGEQGILTGQCTPCLFQFHPQPFCVSVVPVTFLLISLSSSKMSLSSIFLHANTQTCTYTTLALPSSSCLIWAPRVSLWCDTSQQIPADVVQWLADPHALLSKLKLSTLHNKTPQTLLLS